MGTITINTSGYLDFQYSYWANLEPKTFWGITVDGAIVTITFNEAGEVLTFNTVPPPAKPPAASTAGGSNVSPPLYQALGANIPIIFGTLRINGVSLWASSVYAGSSGNVVDIAIAWGTPLEISGDVNPHLIANFWGNGNLFWDAVKGSSVGTLNITEYPGTETQLPDPTIQLQQGVEGTPAFRGLVYTMFKGLPLAPFNNSAASTTFAALFDHTIFGRLRIDYILGKLTERAGFGSSDFTFSSNIDDVCDGGQISSSTDFISLMQGFASIYNFLILEHPLRIKRVAVGGSLVIDKVIAAEEIVSTSTSDDGILVANVEPWSLPNQISLSYISAGLDFQKATMPVKRAIFPLGLTGPLRIQNFDLPFVITDDEAINLAWLMLYRLWTQARTLAFNLLPMHVALEPGDVIQVPVKGITYTAVITRNTIKQDFSNQISAAVLLTDTTLDLTADPGALLPQLVVCPVTPWTILDQSLANDASVTNCGLTATHTTAATNGGARSSSFQSTGKYFFQFHVIAGVQGDFYGLAEQGTSYVVAAFPAASGGVFVSGAGSIFTNGLATTATIGNVDAGQIVSVAVDLDNKKFWCKSNNGFWNGFSTSDPTIPITGIAFNTFSPPFSPIVAWYSGLGVGKGHQVQFNFGQTPFIDQFGNFVFVPAGFTAGWPA